MTGCCDFKIRGFGVSPRQSSLFWSESQPRPVTTGECECWSPGVIMSDVSVSNPGELWHWVRSDIRNLIQWVRKQTEPGNGVMRPEAIIVTSWRVSAFLTRVTSPLHSSLPDSSWAHLRPDVINLFIFPEQGGHRGPHWSGMVMLATDWTELRFSGLWLVDTGPGLSSPGWDWSLPQREAGTELQTIQQQHLCRLVFYEAHYRAFMTIDQMPHKYYLVLLNGSNRPIAGNWQGWVMPRSNIF